MKTLVTTLALIVTTTAASANTIYECEREGGVDVRGFSSYSVAESWMPEEIWFMYSDNRKEAWSMYGHDEKRSKAEIKNGISKYLQSSLLIHIDERKNSDIVDMRLTAPAGNKQLGGARYKCSSSYTNWTPDW